MQMQGGVVELARQAAAAAARAERGARGPARVRVRRHPYRGVMLRGDVYVAQIMDAAGLRPVWLGSYATPEEAAYAYDAAARIMHGDRAKPNFPEPPAPAPTPPARAGVLPLVGHARMRAPLYGQQQPAPPQAPAAVPVGSGAQRQAFSQFLYRPAAGPAPASAAATAGGSNGAGCYGMAPMNSTDKKNKAVVDASAATDPKLVIIIESDSDDEAVVADNFTPAGHGGASTSSAVPPLRLEDLVESEVVRLSSADEGAP